jgi:hypothetical protein
MSTAESLLLVAVWIYCSSAKPPSRGAGCQVKCQMSAVNSSQHSAKATMTFWQACSPTRYHEPGRRSHRAYAAVPSGPEFRWRICVSINMRFVRGSEVLPPCTRGRLCDCPAERPSTHACHAFLPIARNGGCAAGNAAGEVGQKSIPATSDLGRLEQDRDSLSWSRISGGRDKPVKPYVVMLRRSRSRASSGSGSAWEGRSPFCPVRYICSPGWSATGATDGAGARDCDR